LISLHPSQKSTLIDKSPSKPKVIPDDFCQALGHLAKLVHVEQQMKEDQHALAKALKV